MTKPWLWICITAVVLMGAAASTFALGQLTPSGRASRELFNQAEQAKLVSSARFDSILKQLEASEAVLSRNQRWHLRYLLAWHKLVYEGDTAAARAALESIIRDCDDPTVRFRATATLINILATTHHFEDAYKRLSDLIAQLPQIVDKAARFQGLGEAAQLLIAAGQYDLAIDYAGQMLKDIPPGEGTCRANIWALHARYKAGTADSSDPEFKSLIETCEAAGQQLFANGARADVAAMYLREGAPAKALTLLRKHYQEVIHLGYGPLIAQVDVILAKAYLSIGDLAKAKSYAKHAVAAEKKDEYTEFRSTAYSILYELARKEGELAEALQWHEKFMAADKGYLNDVSARALAYQRVKQQVVARKQEIDALNSQNKILQLQQALDRKAAQTSRLSIILLLTVLASIALWLYRLKRSQKRFMRMAHHDGLTGIFNRQHFVEQAERMLASARKEGTSVCLILLDLDHFKLINDSYGHATGDLVLKRAVAMCHDQLRKYDIFGRLGGEEFGILLPDCSLERVNGRAEAIRETIASTSLEDDAPGVTVSASLGVASTEQAGYDLRQLMADADNALYRAKHAGRNRVVVDGLEQLASSPTS